MSATFEALVKTKGLILVDYYWNIKQEDLQLGQQHIMANLFHDTKHHYVKESAIDWYDAYDHFIPTCGAKEMHHVYKFTTGPLCDRFLYIRDLYARKKCDECYSCTWEPIDISDNVQDALELIRQMVFDKGELFNNMEELSMGQEEDSMYKSKFTNYFSQ